MSVLLLLFFFFQAEDGIRVLVRSRGLGDVYKRQVLAQGPEKKVWNDGNIDYVPMGTKIRLESADMQPCLLYTSDAADDLLCVDLGGRRIIKKKKHK